MLARFEPMLFRDFDRLFAPWTEAWVPRIDVIDRSESIVVRAEVPGVPTADLEITAEQGVLSIGGTRNSADETDTYRRRELARGAFRRSIALPDGLDLDSVTAVAKDGVVEITIAKSAAILPRKVEITVA